MSKKSLKQTGTFKAVKVSKTAKKYGTPEMPYQFDAQGKLINPWDLASESQKKLLRELNIDFPSNITKKTASLTIQSALNKKE